MIHVKTFYFNSLRVCTYALWDDDTRRCLLVDTGCESESEQQRLAAFIRDNTLTPVLLVNTHAHFDHLLGNLFAMNTWHIPSAIHPADLPMLNSAAQQSALFGLRIQPPPAATVLLSDTEPLCLGHARLQVLHTPGHTPGGICLYAPDDRFVLTGDTLFAEGIGRTDLPGGDHHALLHSIRHRLMTLPDDVGVLPGHGPATTIGHERTNNPFL